MRNQAFMTLGSTLIILGIVFGEDQLIGYSFFGAGVFLSIISALRLRSKSRTQSNRTGGV